MPAINSRFAPSNYYSNGRNETGCARAFIPLRALQISRLALEIDFTACREASSSLTRSLIRSFAHSLVRVRQQTDPRELSLLCIVQADLD